ncbi:asparagine synthase-related protein [Cupriavidus sp. CP313]
MKDGSSAMSQACAISLLSFSRSTESRIAMVFAILQPDVPRAAGKRTPGRHAWSDAHGHIADFYSSAHADASTLGENPEASWAIAGQIFSGDSGLPASAAEVVQVILRAPEEVSRRFWGPYFVVVYHKLRNRFLILTDPCGQHPVFYRLAADGTLHVGNRITDFPVLGAAAREPDIHFLHQFLVHGCGDPTRTGWSGISLLPPGQALCWTRAAAPERFRAWSPWRWGPQADNRGFVDLLTMVHRSMLRDRDAIVLELSGGIDSTSLAVALRRANLHRRTIAITHFDPMRASSNEVSIARSVARSCDIEHRTYPLLARLPFSSVDRLPAVARPATNLCFLAREADMARLGFRGKDSVILNGHGGDSLYLAPPPFSILVDAVSGLRVVRAASALAALSIQYRLPIWSVLRFAADEASAYLRGPFTQKAQALAAGKECEPPAAGLYDDVLPGISLRMKPGRRHQMAALAAILDDALVEPYAAHSRPVMPFLSQPIVEHALRTRLEETFSADYNRLNVRQAVYRVSGLQNLWRRDKGDIMHAALRGIKANHAHIRETCLDGWCASAGFIDVDGMEKIIKRTALGYPTGLMEITRIYAAEMFVRGLGGNT